MLISSGLAEALVPGACLSVVIVGDVGGLKVAGHLDTGDFNVVLDGVAEPDADHDGEGGGIIEKTMAERII